jgi:phosphopantetheinyl transferase
MPIEKKYTIDRQITVGIWKLSETERFFREKTPKQDNLKADNISNPRLRLQWLAVRHCLRSMLGNNEILIESDEYGKPHLSDTGLHISLSHSHEKVAASFGQVNHGIDIQFTHDNIARIAPKFVDKKEYAWLDDPDNTDMHHLIWSGKEALYKAYGKKELDFKQHISVQPFDFFPETNAIGQIKKEGFEKEYNIWFNRLEDYYVSCAYE